MFLARLTGLGSTVIAAALLLGATPAATEDATKTIKIGVVYDYTGPLAAGGSDLHALGAKIMIDYFNQKGGIEGYQIEPIYADAQSKPDMAINEAVRLIEREKVDILLGFFSSAQCVPVAARVDQARKFMWITTCISSAVLENRNLRYVFRPQPSGRQFGLASTGFVSAYSREKFGKEPKDLRIAIIYEDGAYGVDVSHGTEEGAKQAGFNQPALDLTQGRSERHRRRFSPPRDALLDDQLVSHPHAYQRTALQLPPLTPLGFADYHAEDAP
jgi:ABC-type branched-subunit amino acid transport system substrate-binding protein